MVDPPSYGENDARRGDGDPDRGALPGVRGRGDHTSHVMWCEQTGCKCLCETYCPLCEKLLCKAHDALYPYRLHDCLAGAADELA